MTRTAAKGRASYPAPLQLMLALFALQATASPAPAPAPALPAAVPAPTAAAAADGGTSLREAARARLHHLWAQALPRLGRRRMPLPDLHFYRGRSDAGRAVHAQGALQVSRIELNEDLLERHPEPMLHETVAHELAHLLVFRLHGRRAAAHGAEWQAVMREWFGVRPQRTHTFDLTGLRVRRQQRHRYHCGCREHELSTVRHRRALRGVDYRCLACQGRLRRVDPPTIS